MQTIKLNHTLRENVDHGFVSSTEEIFDFPNQNFVDICTIIIIIISVFIIIEILLTTVAENKGRNQKPFNSRS